MNLFSLLADHPANDDTALVSDLDQTLTKAELLSRVEARAAAIADLSPPAHAPVAVVSAGIEMVVGMFAAWRNDLVLVPVNPRQPDAAIADIIARTDAAVIVDQTGVRARPSDTTHAPGTAFVLWTSGTTGRPKAVLHAHEAYLEIIDRVLGPLRAKPREPSKPPSPNLIPVSMALNAGIYNALFGLRAGAPLVLMNGFDTGDFATLVARHQIRSTVLPPAAMAMLSSDETLSSLAPLRYIRSITAPLSPFQARRFTARFGVTVLNGYGQAEIGEVIGWTAADAKAHPEKLGAIGRPHPGVDIRLASPDQHGVGELLVRPPNHAAGYADGTDLADRLTADGFLRTGDLARLDADDFVWIEGRLSDLINRGGNKVFPEEVEEVLLTVPGVREAAVVAAPDARLGEVPVAFLVGAADTADLDAMCRANLAPYKVPVRYLWRDALPRNEAGKVLRKELAETAATIEEP